MTRLNPRTVGGRSVRTREAESAGAQPLREQ
jgi:hypothetical protein